MPIAGLRRKRHRRAAARSRRGRAASSSAFTTEGADAWYSSPPSRFLGNDRDPDDYEQVTDIVDVWFESGSTHAFVLEARGLPWPADLYLEGSDQHRGWFHSSLLEAVGTRGRAPFKAVLTHGFALDEQGRKMSQVAGQRHRAAGGRRQVRRRHPAPVGDDLRHHRRSAHRPGNPQAAGRAVSPPAQHAALAAGQPRRLHRGRARARGGHAGAGTLGAAPAGRARRAGPRAPSTAYDWTGVYPELHNFCAADLSAFYFDIRKDALYCDRPDSLRRRAARTVLDHLHRCLTTWLAPVLCFTAEEAWTARFGEDASVHLEHFPDSPARWRDAALAAKWERIRDIRRAHHRRARGSARKAGEIGSSLQAAVDAALAADERRCC